MRGESTSPPYRTAAAPVTSYQRTCSSHIVTKITFHVTKPQHRQLRRADVTEPSVFVQHRSQQLYQKPTREIWKRGEKLQATGFGRDGVKPTKHGKRFRSSSPCTINDQVPGEISTPCECRFKTRGGFTNSLSSATPAVQHVLSHSEISSCIPSSYIFPHFKVGNRGGISSADQQPSRNARSQLLLPPQALVFAGVPRYEAKIHLSLLPPKPSSAPPG